MLGSIYPKQVWGRRMLFATSTFWDLNVAKTTSWGEESPDCIILHCQTD
jgi:hypothetical protein